MRNHWTTNRVQQGNTCILTDAHIVDMMREREVDPEKGKHINRLV